MPEKRLRFNVKLVGQEGSSATGFYAPPEVVEKRLVLEALLGKDFAKK